MRTNLATDPRAVAAPAASSGFAAAAIRVSSDRGFGTGGTGTHAAGTGDTALAALISATTYARKSWTNATAATTTADTGFQYGRTGTAGLPVTAGQSISVSAYMRTNRSGVSAFVGVYWYDAAGAAVTATPRSSGAATVLAANVWERRSGAFTVPTGAAFATVVADVGSVTTGWISGNRLDVSGLLVERTATVGAYFDGAMSGSYWTGAADASTTVQPNTVPVLTPHLGGTDGQPRVDVRFDELAPATRSVTVFRQYEGRVDPVREAEGAFASGAYAITDYEAPLGGVAIIYQAQQFDGNGLEIDLTLTASTRIDSAPEDAWISDPRRPAAAVRIEMTENAASKPSNPIPATFHTVGDRRVALVGRRTGLSGVDMSFYTSTTAERDAVDDLIGTASGLVLIRTPPPMPVPRLLYCFAGNATPDEFPAPLQDVEWLNTVDELPAFLGGWAEALVTWQTYEDAFATWAAAEAKYPRWIDAQLNPPTTGG